MVEYILLAVSLALFIAAVVLAKNNASLRFRLRSSAVRHGKTMEQLAPFSKAYPYDPRGFRFIGDPIDGVQFNEDGVVFVEFKSGDAQLSEKQKRIREMLKNKVSFREFRL